MDNTNLSNPFYGNTRRSEIFAHPLTYKEFIEEDKSCNVSVDSTEQACGIGYSKPFIKESWVSKVDIHAKKICRDNSNSSTTLYFKNLYKDSPSNPKVTGNKKNSEKLFFMSIERPMLPFKEASTLSEENIDEGIIGDESGEFRNLSKAEKKLEVISNFAEAIFLKDAKKIIEELHKLTMEKERCQILTSLLNGECSYLTDFVTENKMSNIAIMLLYHRNYPYSQS